MENQQGNLLVASPYLPDPNFYRSIVLIVEHSDEGALGLILNRPGNQLLRDVWQDVCEKGCVSGQYLDIGGPVSGPLMALHSHPELEGLEVVSRVMFSPEQIVLEALVDQEQHAYRIFGGYAGWGEGQLEHEMKTGGWLTTAATWRYVFERDHESLWQDVVNTIGASITQEMLNIRRAPIDPRSN